MASEDHVFTKDELKEKLSNVIGGMSDDVKSSLEPSVLSGIEDVSQGIDQVFARISNLKETVENLQKANEDYKLKMSEYAAEKAERIKPKEEEEPKNPAEVALNKVESEE